MTWLTVNWILSTHRTGIRNAESTDILWRVLWGEIFANQTEFMLASFKRRRK